MTLQKAINRLLSTHYGSISSMSKWTGIDKAYLSRLRSGEKYNPSDETLDKLGIEKVISYRIKY